MARNDYEQLSMFSMNIFPRTAICCFRNEISTAQPIETWMTRLVPNGVYFVNVGGHPLVLQPVEISTNRIPEGHEFYHYIIEDKLYSGTFVGRS